MKIDSTDIREFDAKQLSVEFTPPQTTVTVDMFEGALIPSESETYTPLSGITVVVLECEQPCDEREHERACCHSGTVTQELSQETGRRTTFRPITGGQGTGKNQPHRKEAIHENDRTGTTHQNPASEKNVPDKGAKRET